MSARGRDERGFVLIVAIVLLTVVMALGLGAVAWVDGRQHQARQERTRESSFNVAEAALNAQVLQLGRAWPIATGPPAQCAPSSSADICPQNASITGSYGGADYTVGCGGLPLWTTQIQDNVTGADQFYNAAVLKNPASPAPSWDANGDGVVWLRATGNAQCHSQTIVTLVSRVLATMAFPRSAITANWFQTGNNGNKVIVDTLGAHAHQRADMILRCKGLPANANCTNYQPGQVSPDSVQRDSSAADVTLDDNQLENLRELARYAGTYWPNASGTCPPSGAALSSATSGLWAGSPVFVEGPCTVNLGGGNSDAQPGVLVVVAGTVTLGANNNFYGLIYDANRPATGYTPPAYPTPVVALGGCGIIQGAVVVDNGGGVNVGACKNNIVFDPRAFDLVHTFAGAGIAKSTWRVLAPAQQ